MAGRRGTDATGLTFPLQLVILIITTMSGVFASNYASKATLRDDQAQTRSDVRDILTRLQLATQISEAQSKANEERFNALKATVESQAKQQAESNAAIQRRQELQQIQIQQLSEAITKLSTQQGRK